jgi:hypothetical protein
MFVSSVDPVELGGAYLLDNTYTMSSIKMEVDYSSTVETAIPQAKEIAKSVRPNCSIFWNLG